MFIIVIYCIFFLATHKLKARNIILITLFFIFILFGFGCLGNIRSGYRWNDSSYILSYAHVKKFPFPKQFVWAYIYLISPLGNLNNLFNKVVVNYDISLLLGNCIFDFISKRIFTKKLNTTPLIMDNLVVMTCYSGVYTAYSLFGMVFLDIWAILMALVSLKLTKGDMKFIIILVFSGLTTLSFFDNMYAYSGYSFCIIYPIVICLLEKYKIILKKKRS